VRLHRSISDHQLGHGRALNEKACAMSLEGIVSKRADAAYTPGYRGLWLKVKCLHREEFVAIGWTDPEGSRLHLGAASCRATAAAGQPALAEPRQPAWR
jgi:ATP-dependent DNA ligase